MRRTSPYASRPCLESAAGKSLDSPNARWASRATCPQRRSARDASALDAPRTSRTEPERRDTGNGANELWRPDSARRARELAPTVRDRGTLPAWSNQASQRKNGRLRLR
jgi:hypothetical protein